MTTLQVAKLYGVPVILHTDHCQKAWLPWFDGLIEASEEYFEKNGEPLFSSHMLDLSEESSCGPGHVQQHFFANIKTLYLLEP